MPGCLARSYCSENKSVPVCSFRLESSCRSCPRSLYLILLYFFTFFSLPYFLSSNTANAENISPAIPSHIANIITPTNHATFARYKIIAHKALTKFIVNSRSRTAHFPVFNCISMPQFLHFTIALVFKNALSAVDIGNLAEHLIHLANFEALLMSDTTQLRTRYCAPISYRSSQESIQQN